MKQLREGLGKLKEERFQDYKNIVQVGITGENSYMGEEFDQYWSEISKHRLSIDIGRKRKRKRKYISRSLIKIFF